jgi:hypothetical protein
MAEGTRFVHDRTAAEVALVLANQVSTDRAAHQLGVSKQALRRAFDHHGLPQPAVFQGGPKRSRFYDDPDAAEQAWRRVAEVGINQPRKELELSDRALRTAWRRHGFGPATPPHQPAGRAAAGCGLPGAGPQAAAGPGALGCGAGRAHVAPRSTRSSALRCGGDGQRELR